MERRVKRLTAIYKGGDSETVQRCADYLYWAFGYVPTHAREAERRWLAFRGYIDRSGIDAADVPRALALALSRYLGVSESEATAQVAAFGGDLLAAMGLPPEHRIAFLKCAPDERESFLDTLAAAAHRNGSGRR